MVEFYHAIRESLTAFQPLLSQSINNQDRKKILDALGQAASDYRNQIYNSGFWGKKTNPFHGRFKAIYSC